MLFFFNFFRLKCYFSSIHSFKMSCFPLVFSSKICFKVQTKNTQHISIYRNFMCNFVIGINFCKKKKSYIKFSTELKCSTNFYTFSETKKLIALCFTCILIWLRLLLKQKLAPSNISNAFFFAAFFPLSHSYFSQFKHTKKKMCFPFFHSNAKIKLFGCLNKISDAIAM